MKKWHTQHGETIIQLLAGRSNVFLLTKDQRNVLVDTGPSRKWKSLQRKLQALNIQRIDYLILTHTHFDHAANAYRIKEKYKAKVIVHRNEAAMLASGTNILPCGTNALSHMLVKLLTKGMVRRLNYHPCPCDLQVDTVFDLNAYGSNAYILHTPGHTPGSMSLIVDNELAIVGDAMFGIWKGSVFPPFANDVAMMVKSWGKLLETGCRLFFPAHGSLNSRMLLQKEFDNRI